MVTYKFLKVKDVFSEYVDDVKDDVANKRINAYFSKKSKVILSVEKVGSSYCLRSGFKFFDALKKVKSNQFVPFVVVSEQPDQPSERLLAILKRGMVSESTGWRFKYDLIQKLIHDHHMKVEEIASKTEISVEEIERFNLDADIPDFYKKKAILLHKTELINSIHRTLLIPDNYKSQYYNLALEGKLSTRQLYIAASYYNMSYYHFYNVGYVAY
ncbi:hypothetical protein KO561_15470 [Radiobacillus kanasensis]|uniref:hypothetical protein n=1 Tax=Radiobacillus kanasensis TaxID=2844358 RepID=UPI001E2D5187|nr:hypothetical protein [Radiobacillus kanasensis]UFT98582.1 hypothetical protein KO561_15470 [Radiobacillus kanasensis]